MMGTAIGFTLLLSLFCRCWNERTMPTAFDMARIVAVYKGKGDTGDADNYRPIALLQVCYKLYETIILDRLKRGIGDRTHQYQFGFQSKLSVENAVF